MKRVIAVVTFIVLTASRSGAETLDPSLFTVGECGGIMTGYDGRPYQCGPDREPACEASTGRCVCLERIACGGKRDEPF